MRNNDPVFWPDESGFTSLRQTINKNYSDCINILQNQWYQADLDERFSIGDQDPWGMLFPGTTTTRRKLFNFNYLNRAVQMVSGYQRRNRKMCVCIPVFDECNKTADQFTKALYKIHEKSNAYQIYSDAFELGALTQGFGLVSIFPDYKDDPVSGDIRLRYVDFKSVLIDPFFRDKSLSDARFIWTRQWLDRKDAAILAPDYEGLISELPSGTYRDDKFFYMPEVYQIQFPNYIAWDEYWHLSSREATYIIDKQTHECQEFEGTEEMLRDRMRRPVQNADGSVTEARHLFESVKKQRQTVRRVIMVNDKILIDEEAPYGIDRYPFVGFFGYFHPDTAAYSYKYRGIIRDARDAAYLFNRRKIADLDIIESQQQGLKIKKGALITPDDALNQGHGRVLTIDPAFSMDDVQKMPIDPPAPQLLQMEDMLKQSITEITGVSEELLGSASDDKAGILSMLRQGANLTTLQKFMDQLDQSQKECGEIMIEMIQKNWTFGKVRQVIGEEPTQEFDQKLFFKYGCKVVQGVLTETQKQLEAQQLLFLRGELQIPISTRAILDALPFQNKRRIIEETVEAEKAQQQMQEQEMKLKMHQISVDTDMKEGYAQAQMSIAQERMERIKVDKAKSLEDLRRSDEARTDALLNVVKAIKELKGMDLEHIEQSLAILNEVKLQNQSPQEEKLAAQTTQSQKQTTMENQNGKERL